MIRQLSKKAGFILAVAGAAVVGGATTVFVAAAIPSTSDGQIHGCYQNNTGKGQLKGALRVIDSDAAQTCTAQETGLNWPASNSGSGPRGYAFVVATPNPNTGFANFTVDQSRSKNITITNPQDPNCLTLTSGVPLNASLSGGSGASTPIYVAIKDANGWTDDAAAAQCSADTPAANLYVSSFSISYFLTVY